MTTKTYARVASGAVAELLTIDAAIVVADVFGSAIVLADVTSLGTPPALGATATNTGGIWSFGAAPPPPATPVPALVTRYQLKVCFRGIASGSGTLLDDVAAWAATLPAATQLIWSDAAAFARGGSFIAAAAAHFGWSSATVDGYFQTAAAIPSAA